MRASSAFPSGVAGRQRRCLNDTKAIGGSESGVQRFNEGFMGGS
jgi:hypothetical protein